MSVKACSRTKISRETSVTPELPDGEQLRPGDGDLSPLVIDLVHQLHMAMTVP